MTPPGGVAGITMVALPGAQAPCLFENGSVTGDYVQISSVIFNSLCRDAGSTYPATGGIFGRVIQGTATVAPAASPAGLVRTSNVVTVTTTGAHGLSIGQYFSLFGTTHVGADDFNGILQVCGPPTPGCITPTNTTFTYQSTAANNTGGGGSLNKEAPVLVTLERNQDGPYPTFPASLTTTAAASDNVAISGVVSTSHCAMEATNANAAADSTSTYISATTTNQITVTHPASSGRTWDIICTPN